MLLAEVKRRRRLISSSISCWERWRWLNLSALALNHREKWTSVDGRWDGFGDGGAKIGNGVGNNFSAINRND